MSKKPAKDIQVGDKIIIDGKPVTVTDITGQPGKYWLGYKGGSKSGVLDCDPGRLITWGDDQ